MSEHCRNCGSELFVGQRFCRACGVPTDELSQEEAPTQMMPPQYEGRGQRSGANTAPSAAPDTSPVYPPATIGYQPPMHPQAIPPYTPPQKRTPIGWILAFIGMGLFVMIVIAVMFAARAARRAVNNLANTSLAPPVAQPGEIALESNADQNTAAGNETTLIKTFALAPGSKFSIRNINGSISIDTWDQPKAQVKVVKRGRDRGAQIFFTSGANNLALRTGLPGGDNSLEVRYEVKLPRDMERVNLESANGSVKLSNVSAKILVQSANGTVELNDVVGVSKVQTANGKITASLAGASDWPMEFVTANGKIDLTIKPDFDAELDASTIRGSLSVDDQLGITVQKELVGQHARGQIGSGGQPLKLTAVNGSVKLSKQQ
jgi:hypothetical protein